MGHRHELVQGWIPEDGIVWQANVGDIGVNELGTVVLALSKGDREADLPYRGGRTISDSRERLGWLKLIVRHLEIVECLYGQDVEPCPAVDEGPGDLHVADDWGTKHREDASSSCAPELICRAESDGAIGPPERAWHRAWGGLHSLRERTA